MAEGLEFGCVSKFHTMASPMHLMSKIWHFSPAMPLKSSYFNMDIFNAASLNPEKSRFA